MIRASFRFAAIFAFCLVVSGPAMGDDRDGRPQYEREFQKTTAWKGGQRVEIEHSQGAVRIRTHKLPEVRIQARIHISSSQEAEAKKFGDAIAITVEETGTGVLVRTKYPEKKWSFEGSGHISFSVDYDILMPETAPLSVRNKFGEISVEGLKASATLSNANGSTSFRDGRGTQKLENAFGTIELTRNVGDVGVSCSNGAVAVTDVEGSLDLRNRFGSVTVTKIRGKAQVVSSNGTVTVADVTGPATITGSFGKVSVRDVTGALEIENSNGPVEATKVGSSARVRNSFGSVEVSGVSGDAVVDNSNAGVTLTDVSGSAQVHTSFGAVRIAKVGKGVRVTGENGNVSVADLGAAAFLQTSFGLIEAARVAGDLTAENANGAVKASGIKGEASVKTSFASVTLDGIGGKIEVENQNGSIEVRGVPSSAGKCFPLSLTSSFGPIRVYLPEGTGFKVDARTSFGKVHSDMPLSIAGSIGGDSISGTIGDGKCPLTLANSNGNIDLLKGR
jgi:putative adhesin